MSPAQTRSRCATLCPVPLCATAKCCSHRFSATGQWCAESVVALNRRRTRAEHSCAEALCLHQPGHPLLPTTHSLSLEFSMHPRTAIGMSRSVDSADG